MAYPSTSRLFTWKSIPIVGTKDCVNVSSTNRKVRQDFPVFEFPTISTLSAVAAPDDGALPPAPPVLDGGVDILMEMKALKRKYSKRAFNG